MSHLGEANEEDNFEFKWGDKRGVGKNGAAQFYESFTFDGVEYFLHDCVYLWHDDEPQPYIGKLVKIWEMNHKKTVKIVWFFRPIEILHWLGDDEPLKNELFLASGEGKGLSNLNPLEAIAGKCNVVCTSKDQRNPQSSEEELSMADFSFYRNFDVGSCTISDKFVNTIAGIKVEYFFNRKKDQKLIAPPKLANLKERTGNSSLFSKLELDKVVEKAVKDGKSGSTTRSLLKESKRPAASLGERGRFSDENTESRPKRFIEKDGTGAGAGAGAGRISCSQVNDKCKLKFSEDFSPTSASEDQPLKKRKLLGTSGKSLLELKSNVSPPLILGEGNNTESMRALTVGSKDSGIQNRGLSKEVNFHEKAGKISDKAAAQLTRDKGVKTDGQIVEVTRRPDDDTRKWFKQLPWEETMQRAQEQGTLVLLENLDPSYTSSEVEDIIWHAFKEKVTAKMIQRNTFSSPHYGQAFVKFKSKYAAESAISELNRKCLMLENGRPVIGRIATPREPGKPTRFAGHLVIENIRLQKQREEMKNAVSTSHYSQPNTIEYEMAIEWRVLQEKSDRWWAALHKQQAKEIQNVKRAKDPS